MLGVCAVGLGARLRGRGGGVGGVGPAGVERSRRGLRGQSRDRRFERGPRLPRPQHGTDGPVRDDAGDATLDIRTRTPQRPIRRRPPHQPDRSRR